MSIAITTDIFCDADDCGDWVSGVVGPRTNAQAARKAARRAGWSTTHKGDFCPCCRSLPPAKDTQP